MLQIVDAVRRPTTRNRIVSVNSASDVDRSASIAAAGQCIDLYPADLLSDDSSIHQKGATRSNGWWLAHTRPRQEKSAANDLFAREVAFYLPLVVRKSLTRGRTRCVRIPLFPGYIFICGNDQDRLRALKTNRILAIHEVPDGDCLRRQLMSFAALIGAGAPLVRESRLVAGDRVRIKTGLFRGVEGVILRRHGKTELLIAIDFLGQGASLEIEDCGTEPV